MNTTGHIWKLTGNSPVLNLLMMIYHYVERIWRIIVTPNFYIAYKIMNKYYPFKPDNTHIQSLINNIQENNKVIASK